MADGKIVIDVTVNDKEVKSARDSIENLADSAEQSGSRIGTGLKLALGAAVATVTAAGVALGKTISSAITEGADLQQSLGGIETLFKSSAGTVKKYADEAYRTAGLSANAYMENVTSFSASLLQSLGGDTAKAADVANMAMIDMSDNANKMGTNMQDIQNAYQGFAKQNYTMLDNLKLGYGGTQEEMKRLLADAQKLTGVKYDINNLSDVYNAIHAIQENLDITGTTAKEAAETFSGSFAAMKAAASNVLGKMALGQDIRPALNALAETTSTFLLGNFLPMVINILKALPEAVATLFSSAGPMILQVGKEFLGNLVKGMNGDSPINSGAFLWIKDAIKWISLDLQNLSIQIQDRVGKIKAVFQSVLQGIQPIITKVSAIISGWATAISAVLSYAIPIAIDIVLGVFDKLQQFLLPLFDTIVDAFWTVSSTVTEAILNNVVPALQNFMDYISQNKGVIDLLTGAIVAVGGAFLAFRGYLAITDLINNVKGAIDTLKVSFGLLKTAMATNPFGLIALAIGALVGVIIYLWNTNEGFKNAVITAWNAIQAFMQPIITAIVSFVQSIWGGLVTWWNENQQLILTTVQTVWGAIQIVFATIMGSIELVITTVLTAIQVFWNTWGSAITAVVRVMWAAIKSIFQSTLNTIMAIVSGVMKQIQTIINTVMGVIQGIIKVITGAIKGDWSQVWSGIKQIVVTVFNGIKNTISNVLETAKSIVSGKINAIKSFFKSIGDIDLFQIGKNVIQGLINGIGSMVNAVKNKISEVAAGIKDKITGALGIHSPSRWMRDQVGKFIPQGIAVGIDKDADTALKSMKRLSTNLMNLTPETVLATNRIGMFGMGSQIVNNNFNQESKSDQMVGTSFEIPVTVEMSNQKVGKAVAKFSWEEIQKMQRRQKRSQEGIT
ncbi:phage tail protein [Enterococcus gallinarum]|uniref:phage tail protein n=1 Tax=Enterococcus gallinarum TaxID=1353 RepID=UPI00214C0A6A|nr:phage tail protein [Enterococcus gallinarum]MCR1943365.1 phage tail protein [Enterococcus gallinarum]